MKGKKVTVKITYEDYLVLNRIYKDALEHKNYFENINVNYKNKSEFYNDWVNRYCIGITKLNKKEFDHIQCSWDVKKYMNMNFETSAKKCKVVSFILRKDVARNIEYYMQPYCNFSVNEIVYRLLIFTIKKLGTK